MRFIPDDKKFKPTVKKKPKDYRPSTVTGTRQRVNPHATSSKLPLEGFREFLGIAKDQKWSPQGEPKKKSVSIREAMEMMEQGRKKTPGHTDSEMQKFGGKDGGPEPKPKEKKKQ
jgi:hypothetical protein